MSKGISILGSGRAVPKHGMSNEELSQMVDTSDEWITSRTGIKNRFVCEDETHADLAYEAARLAIEDAGIDKNLIGIVIVATSSADYALPSTACLLQERLGLLEDVVSFDLTAACTGFVYGLRVCNDMLCNDRKKYALLVGCERLSRLVDYTDRGTCILFGDGAGAVVLEKAEKDFADALFSRGNTHALSCKGAACEGARIEMDGKEVFRFAVSAIKKAVDQVLESSQRTMGEIDYVICHQANQRILEHVAKKYKCEEKFYSNIAEYGNTSAASIPIALDEMRKKDMLKPGMRVICVGFGAGLTYGSVMMEV